MLKVLKSQAQIDAARAELMRMGASCVSRPWVVLLRRILRKLGIATNPDMGDLVKSWDVLETIRFVERNVPKDAPVLDIGAYACEILVALDRLGYSSLHGIDLDPRIKRMPCADRISYLEQNFHCTQFPDASFAAITSISVIEHGYDPDALCREVSRLLQPGGYFMASFDYWPDKIDTANEKIFGMTWLIFSKQDVSDLLEAARRYGLVPTGELDYSGRDRPIDFSGKQYTFGWLALRKNG